MRAAIVTAADAAYFPYLADLLRSIAAHRPSSSDISVGVLDTGLTPQQRGDVAHLTNRIVAPGWDLPVPQGTPSWFQAMTARAFLPRHFPDADVLVWIDADAWLQDWRAVDTLVTAASGGAISIVTEPDHRSRPQLVDFLRRSYRQSFGDGAASLGAATVYNSGVLAMRRDVPHWSVWADLIAQGLQRPGHKLIEQCALNVAIHGGRIPAQVVPVWCNWVCSYELPMLDGERLVTPTGLEPISIVHVLGARGATVTVPSRDGRTLRTRLDRDAFMQAVGGRGAA